jgi:alpha-N-arabinofuranosidase
MTVRSITILLTLAAIGAALPAATVRAQAAGKITINVDQPGAKISPLFYGLMTEEINHSYDGGLYAELIQNRIFQDTAGGGRGRGGAPGAAPAIPHWSVYGNGGTIAIDSNNTVNTGALKNSLRLDITTADGPVGVANDGYWGIPVKPNTAYQASFYAKAGNGFTGQLTAAIVGNDGKIYASGKVDVGEKFEQKKLTLKTEGSLQPTSDAKFVISGTSKGSVYFSQVSLFPPVSKARTGAALGSRPTTGFRPDIMQFLADMNPSFLRFPGGNYVEGPNYDARYNFKTTIGSWEERPGHAGSWSYRSSDGLGLLEFLEWCEEIKMEPILAVNAGLFLDRGADIRTGDALKPFIQDALDEIEYVSGDKSTTWGARRAKDGHPEPFKLNYVEVGNEDFLNNGTATYRGPDGRYALFYNAIKAQYPQLQIIATTNPGVKHDVIDNHHYMPPATAIRNAHLYDRTDRNGPKVFEGEWASQETSGPGGVGQRPYTPTFEAAISDAAFLTGLERNADIVIMSCYAPLLCRVEPGGSQWRTNLIGYNTLTSYGSPPYYVQKMFFNAKGDTVLPVASITPQVIVAATQTAPAASAPGGGRGRGGPPQPPSPNEPLFASASSEASTGDIIVKVVNIFPADQAMELDLSGAKNIQPKATAQVMQAQPSDTNSITEPTKVVPKTVEINDASAAWKHTFPGNSISVIRFHTK